MVDKRFNIISHESLDSTNDEAKRYLLKNNNFNEDVVVIKSNIQTKGKGRLGRNWQSGKGNLLVSLIIKPECDFRCFGQISFVTSVALRNTICKFIDNKDCNLTKLKWPNDVILDNKKISGILLETVLGGKNNNHLIVGIGVNIKSYPKLNLRSPATCLNEYNNNISEEEFLYSLLDEFYDLICSWKRFGFSEFKETWQKHAKSINSQIIFNSGNNEIKGVFTGINDEGEIVIKQKNNKVMSFSSGEINFL